MSRRAARRGRVGGVPVLVITSPLQIPGIAAWYRMDLLVTQAGTVSAWGDSSGTGDANKNLAQATAGKRPTYTASDAAYNNQPTASYAAASLQELDSAAWAAALVQPYTIFVVGNDAGAGTPGWVSNAASGAGAINYGNGSANMNAYAGSFLSSTLGANAAKKMVGALYSGASSAIWENSSTATATGNAGAASLTDIVVGANPGSGIFLNGKIAEVVVYSRALNAMETRALVAYFAARYAMAIS